MQETAGTDESSTPTARSPLEIPETEQRDPSLGVVLRFAIGIASSLTTAGLVFLLIADPLTARLDLWAVLFFANGLLLGPPGLLGSAIVRFIVTLPDITHPIRLVVQTGAYVLVGVIAASVFRLARGSGRSLSDLRSYLAFVAAAASGSLVLAGIGSATLFWGTAMDGAYWTGVIYWFSGAVTTLLIVMPFILVVASSKIRRRRIAKPLSRHPVGLAGRAPSTDRWNAKRATNRDIVVVAVLVLGITAVVSPLVHLNPHYGSWLALLYLVPILLGSTTRGLRGGILVASGSGIAYLVGSLTSSVLLPRVLSHDEVLGQFIGLVTLSVVGAITGFFQQARLTAESALLQSKLELQNRHESLALVHGLADRLKHTLDIETIAREAVEALSQLDHPPMAAVHLLDESGVTLELVAQLGFDDRTIAVSRNLPIEGSLSGAALSKREILVSENVAMDPRIEPATRSLLMETGFVSVVSVPLVFEQQALGVVNLVFRDRPITVVHDFQTLSTIGRTVALAIVNARHVSRLDHLAFHDLLTGLPNREGLHRWFSESAFPEHEKDRTFGLALLDFTRFHEVNDALGHQVGDRLLAEIGPRIASASREQEPLVFRLSGNAFAVGLRDLKEAADYVRATEELVNSLAAPFKISGMAVQIEANAGIAVFPADGLTSSELLRCADVAAHHATRTGSRVVRYHPTLDQHTPERLALAADLSRAILDDQLVLHFQPKVILADGRPIGFEALVRWNHPTLGLLQPDQFIPIAEMGDLIHPLTYWVVEHALEQLNTWRRFGSRFTMAVNLSTRNLLDHSCAERLERIVKRSRTDPAMVEFELTETALLIDPEAASETLTKIAQTGARVVIDDFGTGYSSMAFLKRCPIHSLKIDRSFVGDMLSDVQSRAIVRATVQLAEDLGLAVVAEGIEDAGTAEALNSLGCEVGQGFFFQKPKPAEQVERDLAAWGSKTI